MEWISRLLLAPFQREVLTPSRPASRLLNNFDSGTSSVSDTAGSSARPDSCADASFLNAQNRVETRATEPDPNGQIVVAGGGIHALIYAIHVRKRCLQASSGATADHAPSITVFEKSDSPGYKIGESTLTVLGLWLKTVGLGPALLWRLFGPKDGLAFYYLDEDDPDAMGCFSANGPPGDFVPTLQMERKVSELLLTLFAQRLGVRVLHGHKVDVNATLIPREDSEDPVRVQVSDGCRDFVAEASLLVDATGRFRRLTSKASRAQRAQRSPGFNTDAYWAYFETDAEDSDIDLPYYESCNTNHVCLKEGWAWIIRLPSWEGSPIPNMVAMLNFLLDMNAKDAHPDEYPSSLDLAEKFGLKFRWVVSIGYALRDDIEYPQDLSSHGSCEAERKFNWVTGRYERMKKFMSRHRLIKDLYGPKTTWFVRKKMSYQSTIVHGPKWAAIGDATGFTNPLYSPGINCNMATSIKLAEMTPDYLSRRTAQERAAMLVDYQSFCAARMPHMQRMNVFNYLTMRSCRTGPLGPLWQYLAGTGNEQWQRLRSYDLNNVAEIATKWEWGSNQPAYIEFAEKAIELLSGPPSTGPDPETVYAVLKLSEEMVKGALASGKYKNRWAGLLRWYDGDLKFCAEKTGRDVLARKCEACGNWRILRNDIRRCATCGAENRQNAVDMYI